MVNKLTAKFSMQFHQVFMCGGILDDLHLLPAECAGERIFKISQDLMT